MKNFSKKLTLFFLIFGVNLVFFNLAYAADENPLPLVQQFVETGIRIGLALALLVIILGGVCYVLSLGGIEVIGTTRLIEFGRENIKAGVTALLILGCFYSLMSIVNPDWTTYHPFSGMAPVTEEELEPTPPPGGGPVAGIATYQEIPLGTAIENVLARPIHCFKFDILGDITDANSATSEFEPLLKHDRIDCTYEVIKAMKAKAKEVVVLMKKYQELLKQCECRYCKCMCNGCGERCGTTCPDYYCENGRCRCEGRSCDCSGWCTSGPNCNPNCQMECCPCPRGSDESICKTDLSECNYATGEKCYDVCPPKIRQKMESFWREHFEPDDPSVLQDFLTKERDYFKCISDCLEEKKSPEQCVQQCDSLNPSEDYKNLKIRNQFEYLKTKIIETQEGLRTDQETLVTVKNRIEQDYLVEPYIEFVKISEETKKLYEAEIMINRFTAQGEEILPNRYCKGYNYLNYTSCYGDNYLPTTLTAGLSEEERDEKLRELHEKLCFGACTGYCRTQATSAMDSLDIGDFYDCLNTNTPCGCYCESLPEDRKAECQSACPQAIQECNNQFNWCEPRCETEKNDCRTKCENWVQDGKNQCQTLLADNNEGIERCKQVFEERLEDCYQDCDTEKEVCVDHCYTAYILPCYSKYYDSGCNFATDQYAGYEECLKDCYYKSPEECNQNYSSYYSFKNRDKLKCPYCSAVQVWKLGVYWYDSPGTDIYPRAQKCLPCSACSECPCLTSSGECNEYAYNDDPLTFYSKIGGAEERYAGPLSDAEMYCDEKEEIPVGRLADGTIVFADEAITELEDKTKIADIEFKIIDSLKPDNFKCEGRIGRLNELLEILLETPVTEITTAKLDEMIADPPANLLAAPLAQIDGNSVQVETWDAVGIQTTSATLRGNLVEDDGKGQFYNFKWRKEGGTFSGTPCLGPIREGTTFSHNLTNLSTGTQYEFRACICAGDDHPEVCGDTKSFTTLPVLLPQVNTLDAYDISANSATLKGEVVDTGNENPERYFFWGTSAGSLPNKETAGTAGVGYFYKTLSGLTENTTYYFKACARNSKGESCGEVKSFTTLSISSPLVRTLDATDIKADGANLVGEVVDTGNENPERYFFWGTSAGSLPNKETAGTAGVGYFYKTLSGLTENTTYYFKACARNSKGESCGEVKSFKTLLPSPPQGRTVDIDPADIQAHSATIKGEVVDTGGESCERYFLWGEKQGAQCSDSSLVNKEDVGIGGVGIFQKTIVCLTENTTYCFKACTKNSLGESCGDIKSFTTQDVAPSTPTCTTLDLEEMTTTSAVLRGKVTDWGGSGGSCQFFWGKAEEPCEKYKYTSWVPYEEQCDIFEYEISVEPNTTYRFFARCKNASGTGPWSGEGVPTTPGLPECISLYPNISQEKVILNGQVDDDGGASCQARFTVGYTDVIGGEHQFTTDWQGEYKTDDPFTKIVKCDGYGLIEGEYWVEAELNNPSSGATVSCGRINFTVDAAHANPIPMPPYVFSVFPKNQHEISLNWEKGSQADQTRIERKQGNTPPKNRGEGVLVYFGPDTHFVDRDLEPNTSYSYNAWGYNSTWGLWSTKHTVAGLGAIEDPTETTAEPVLRCETGCECFQLPIIVCDEYGNCQLIGWYCACRILPCEGDPTNIEKEIEGLEKIVELIENNLTGFKYGEVGGKITITGKRSEGLKKLTYSRKEMNYCAQIYVGARGEETEEIREKVKCLSCTRVLDENLLPRGREECYGAKKNAFPDLTKTDDWFHCLLPEEEAKK